jgi:hypothetical protein
MQLKTIKSKNNDCGTAPGNLVTYFVIDNNKALPKVNLKTLI